MSKALILIDTSIFLNILNVPNKNQDKEKVITDFETYIELGASFILPMATIIETGNHIAQNGDGNIRRQIATRFCKEVQNGFAGEAPYSISQFPTTHEITEWLNNFPDYAGRNKSPEKSEGTSFGDLTIIQEFEKQKIQHSTYQIWIWSLDSDLAQYQYNP